MTRTTWAGLVSALTIVTLGRHAVAQQITLNPGFRPDPTQVMGASGGTISAQGVLGNCRGWIAARPNFDVIVPQGLGFLRVYAESQGDTTLMVRGIQQTWCADDTYGLNPGVDIQGLPPGRYDVYVGSYASGQSFPFQLTFTESPAVRPGAVPSTNGYPPGNGYPPTNGYPPVNGLQPQPPVRTLPSSLGPLTPDASPNYGEVVIPTRFAHPVTANGRSGGSLPATSVRGRSGACAGYVTAQPDHVMMVPNHEDFLRLYVMSAADTTLIVRQPDGSILCNDDTYGFNPSVSGSFEPGVYQVWIGGYHASEVRPYRLTVTNDRDQHP